MGEANAIVSLTSGQFIGRTKFEVVLHFGWSHWAAVSIRGLIDEIADETREAAEARAIEKARELAKEALAQLG